MEWRKGMEAYYPVNDEKNNQLYKEYRKLASKEKMLFSVVDWQNINIMICIK